MNFSNQLITLLDDLGRRFGLAIDWSQENIMPYLQELAGKYISWEMATSWMWIALGAVLILSGIALIVLDVEDVFGYSASGFGYIFGSLFLLVGLVIVFMEAYDILTCIYFPEKQILDYITLLME